MPTHYLFRPTDSISGLLIDTDLTHYVMNQDAFKDDPLMAGMVGVRPYDSAGSYMAVSGEHVVDYVAVPSAGDIHPPPADPDGPVVTAPDGTKWQLTVTTTGGTKWKRPVTP